MTPAALFWTLLAQTIGGLTPAFTKLALEGFSPWTLVACRQALGAVILLGIYRATRTAPARALTTRDWWLLVALAWAGFALPMSLLAFGIERSTATHCALMAPLEPLGIALGGALWLGERLTIPRVGALVLGGLGATLIVTGSDAGAGTGDRAGDALIVVGYLAWSIYTLAAKPLSARHAPERVTLLAAALTVPPLLALAAAESPRREPDIEALGWLLLLAVLSSALCSLAWNRALHTISASTMAAFIFVQPVVGWAAGALFLGEPVGASAPLGAGLIAAGVAWVGRAERRGERAAPGETPAITEPAPALATTAPGLVAAASPAAPCDRDTVQSAAGTESDLDGGSPVDDSLTQESADALAPGTSADAERQLAPEPPAQAVAEPAGSSPDAPVQSSAPDAPQLAAPPRPPAGPRSESTPTAPERTARVEVDPTSFTTLHEIVRAARSRLPAATWRDLVAGSETETTARRNRRALDALALRPRVLRDVERVDPGTTALGQRLRIPVVIAPLEDAQSLHPAGALACAHAAARFGTIHVQSAATLPELETTREAGGPQILQLYAHGDPERIDAQIERAIAQGCLGVCLTVDAPVQPPRHRGAAIAHAGAPPAPRDVPLGWKYVEHYRQRFALPLLLKGIATAQDALLACEHGVDVLYVSNHGGRALDHGRGAIAILPEIADTVSGRARVWVDGGFCRGTDVIKALALGADVVGIGRLAAFGLAAAGADGVLRVLEILEDEIATTLALIGATGVGALDRACVERTEPLGEARVLGTFPALDD
jgi:isopentenyl diphosphate isomerase/L-lactate dehydrogenase-like FMN-dependent dehydrogenase/drug/metabolite transporter (DMT)-like permease